MLGTNCIIVISAYNDYDRLQQYVRGMDTFGCKAKVYFIRWKGATRGLTKKTIRKKRDSLQA